MKMSRFSTTMAGALAASLLALVMLAQPADAAFPGKNGKLAFDSLLPGQADSEIVTLTYTPGDAPHEDPDAPLTDNTAQDSGPAWSPDGSQLAFASERDGDLDIWAMKPVPEGPSNAPRTSPTTAAAARSTPTRRGRRICPIARQG